MTIVKFTHGIAIAIDYGLEMLFFWRIHTPMTLSSQAGLALERGEKWTPAAMLGRVLEWLSPGHTDDAILADIDRCTAALDLLHGNPPL